VLAASAAVSAGAQAVISTAQAVLAASAAVSAGAQAVLAGSAALSASNSAGLLTTQVTTVTGAYTQTVTDSVIVANSSNYTIKLVSIPTGQQVTVTKPSYTNSSAVAAVTISGSAAITIAGTSAIQLVGAGDFMTMVFDGSNYQLIADKITSRSHLNRTGSFGTVDTRVRAFGSITFSEGNCHQIIAGSGTATGTVVTINVPGRYAFTYGEVMAVADVFGLVLNGSGLTTTGLASLATHPKVLCMSQQNNADMGATVSWSGFLNAGDTVRPMTNGGVGASGSPATYASFRVERL
jgi:hypothetical protein